jgi:hypothetical protein
MCTLTLPAICPVVLKHPRERGPRLVLRVLLERRGVELAPQVDAQRPRAPARSRPV